MLYFLDTNICIHYMRKGVFTDRIRSRIIQYGLRSIKIPAIVTGELMCGAYKSKRPEKTLKETLLIAATALSCNAALVTNNTQEFSRIDSLNLTDWTI